MSLKSKIEAVIYASEEPVTLAQLVGLLGEEALAEIEEQRAKQTELALEITDGPDAEETEASNAEEPIETVNAEATEEAALEESAGVGDQHSSEGEPFTGGAADTASEGAVLEESAPETASLETLKDPEAEKKLQREQERAIRDYLRAQVDALIREYEEGDRGIEVREVAGGYRFGTKPEYHDAVRGFVKSLKPPLKLSLQALETLAVVAYKQPVTAAEISEIRGVDSAGVLGGLMTRKLIQTAGRKQVVGRPMLYKTTKEFLVRFGLKDVNELPSIEEFEKMAGELNEQEDLPMDEAATRAIIEDANARGDAETIAGELAVDAQPDGDGHSVEDEGAEKTSPDGELLVTESGDEPSE
ncbi:MAG: SMC-Scp complex subunit ScpB [Acidobacteria bacterium]|nr:SMC-Scp complex subunit ScpB [Acidobacteriota bacterium]